MVRLARLVCHLKQQVVLSCNLVLHIGGDVGAAGGKLHHLALHRDKQFNGQCGRGWVGQGGGGWPLPGSAPATQWHTPLRNFSLAGRQISCLRHCSGPTSHTQLAGGPAKLSGEQVAPSTTLLPTPQVTLAAREVRNLSVSNWCPALLQLMWSMIGRHLVSHWLRGDLHLLPPLAFYTIEAIYKG